ncbi:MAG: ABC transporter ATP-binding protein [candidate division Zixibacteria bacterium]|nr:ABC transporter ATP-binding protein [candidate division Zixibacteria bacterium]
MNDSNIAIEVKELSKIFKSGLKGGEVQALSEVSLKVDKGDIFGLLGPNGAGKTTLVKVLLGALHATKGSASVYGLDVRNANSRNKAGFLPENHRFPDYMTGAQMLKVYGGMSGLSSGEIKARSKDLLEIVGMSKWRDMKIKKYSKGMKQRLGLAQALINDPEIIFLDEPTDGVDPVGRREIRDILKRLKEQGKTVFLNSHLLAEVEAVCDKVAILDKGKLIKTGPVSELTRVSSTYQIETIQLPIEAAEQIKTAFPHAKLLTDNKISITFEDPRQLNSLIDILRKLNVEITAAIPVKISLEDSFMQLLRGEVKHG